MPEGIGYPPKKKRAGNPNNKKRKRGFLPIAQDITRRIKAATAAGDLPELGKAEKERDQLLGTLQRARRGKGPDVAVRKRGRTLREKGRNLLREAGRFVRGEPHSQFGPREDRGTRGTAVAGEEGEVKLFGPRGKRRAKRALTRQELLTGIGKRTGQLSKEQAATGEAARKTIAKGRKLKRGTAEAVRKGPIRATRGRDRLAELEAMGLVTQRDRKRFLRREERRLLGR